MQHGPLRISTNLILQQRWRNVHRLLVGKLLFTWWVGVGGPFGGDARLENKWKKSNLARLHLQKTLPHRHAQARSQRTRAKQTVTRKRHNGGLQPPRLDTTSRLVMVMFVVCVLRSEHINYWCHPGWGLFQLIISYCRVPKSVLVLGLSTNCQTQFWLEHPTTRFPASKPVPQNMQFSSMCICAQGKKITGSRTST